MERFYRASPEIEANVIERLIMHLTTRKESAMFGWIQRLFSAEGGYDDGKYNQEPCIGCQQAQQRISNVANGEWTQCHICRCVWMRKSRAISWMKDE